MLISSNRIIQEVDFAALCDAVVMDTLFAFLPFVKLTMFLDYIASGAKQDSVLARLLSLPILKWA